MIIVDAHQDIAYNAASFNRDYTRPAYKTRRLEAPNTPEKGPGWATLGLPDALIGRVGVAFATLFVMPANSPFMTGYPQPYYRDARQAYDLAVKQMDYYERLAGENEQLQLIKSAADLDAVLATWAAGSPLQSRRQGLVVLMEGADPIIEPKQFDEWYERGVRIVGPAWSKTRYTAGTGEPGPLTPLGFELLETMQDYNTILDLSHLAEKAFFQAVDRYEGAIIASHSNPRHFRDSDRNISDEMIRVLAERDGVVGVVLFNPFLDPEWRKGDSRVPFIRILDVIDHICQVTGSAQHVGIGSDLDGGFGAESAPMGVDSVGDLWWITTALRKRGYNEADIEAIAGGNFLRKLREVLP